MIRVHIKGLEQAQAANRRLMAAVKPQGGLGRAVQYMAMEAQRFAISYTHVWTGALRASHRTTQEGPARWRVYIDPIATNPISRSRTAVYGPVEHSRGGDHAFYGRTYSNGRSIAQRAALYLRGTLP